MSYSRWSNSCWYTYWDSGASGDTKEAQVFTVKSGLRELKMSYQELENDRQGFMDEVYVTFEGMQEDELAELEDYIDAFMWDVEEDFGEGR